MTTSSRPSWDPATSRCVWVGGWVGEGEAQAGGGVWVREWPREMGSCHLAVRPAPSLRAWPQGLAPRSVVPFPRACPHALSPGPGPMACPHARTPTSSPRTFVCWSRGCPVPMCVGEGVAQGEAWVGEGVAQGEGRVCWSRGCPVPMPRH